MSDMRDVADRLDRAAWALKDRARHAEEQGMDFEASRLQGKYEGVRLALSYVDEYLRTEHVPSPLARSRGGGSSASAGRSPPTHSRGRTHQPRQIRPQPLTERLPQ